MADDHIRNAEPWPLAGRSSWSSAEEEANARKLNAEAQFAEEKHFWVKVRRWGQGALGLFVFEVFVVVVVVLFIVYS